MMVNCSYCHKEFNASPSRVKSRISLFCSKECQKLGYSKDKVYNYNRTICTCEHCGKEFEKRHSQTERYKKNFCSRECYFQYKTNHRKKRKYIVTFSTRVKSLMIYVFWRRAVYKKDNYTCQECGSKESIEAHHKKSFDEIIKEHDISTIEDARNCKELWDVENGVTLCTSCHSTKHDEFFVKYWNERKSKKVA